MKKITVVECPYCKSTNNSLHRSNILKDSSRRFDCHSCRKVFLHEEKEKVSYQIIAAIKMIENARELLDKALNETEFEAVYNDYIRRTFGELLVGRSYELGLKEIAERLHQEEMSMEV